MMLCVPVLADHGLDSPICPHFGAAPLFLLVDRETGACRALPHAHDPREHGRCAPLAALSGHPIDAMVVSGMGAGAIAKLSAAGVRVLRTSAGTVAEALAELAAGRLPDMDPAAACAGRGHGHGHAC